VGYVFLPDDTQRLAVIGRTGSGKTQAAVWHLSNRDFITKPWIVLNFKGDELIDAIPYTTELDLSDAAPKKSGIYIVRPVPHEIEELDAFLWKVWERENTGLYFDEGYMVGNIPSFRALLTQGRSKRIPMIVLTQRPVLISRFVWSESDFFQVFALTNAQDQKTVREWMPYPDNPDIVPEFNSIYHDVKHATTVIMRPVPDRDALLTVFRNRLRIPRKAI
jgi:hypothetical protein